MKYLTLTIALLLTLTFRANAGGLAWTLDQYRSTVLNSSAIFKAKVIKHSRAYFLNGKKIELSKESDYSKYLKEGEKLPDIHTEVTLKITSVEKGNTYKVGQSVTVTWKDAAFIVCPHVENKTLDGKIYCWYKRDKKLRILPYKLINFQDKEPELPKL